MSEITIHHCDVKDCGSQSNCHLDLPAMTIKSHTTDETGTYIITSNRRRFDLCQQHMKEFMESSFIRDSLVKPARVFKPDVR